MKDFMMDDEMAQVYLKQALMWYYLFEKMCVIMMCMYCIAENLDCRLGVLVATCGAVAENSKRAFKCI